ncbi:antigen UB05, putative [Plasmodium gallinaceum]|uniref:Antigen UB05, putative n=1 Tax=Plasmodium gallinaceum TaxID=5849 RepID=A0A1J1H1I1_PLAGA|nr:antigen UB05, putative [Plasmodium gallinaceum]CRG97387.1 antigen UB05, putative [Plasmodium gallinaceum]
MGSHIQASRFLDSAVLSLFAMIISASFLYMFSEFYTLSIESKIFNNKISLILSRLFPFKKTFEYNLTHILLLTICIIILSLKPDYDFHNKINVKESTNKNIQNKEEYSQESEESDTKRKAREKRK